MPRVLIVGSDQPRAVALRLALQSQGFTVLWSTDAAQAAGLASRADVVIVASSDCEPPEAAIECIRARGRAGVPILVLPLHDPNDHHDDEAHRRVRIQLGDVRINFETYRAERGGAELKLSPREFELLRYLVDNAERVVSREELLEEIWGGYGDALTRTVDVHIAKLRRKIGDSPTEPRFIRTVPRSGYRFVAVST